MSIFVLVNPASANGRTGRRWPEMAAALRARLGDFSVELTDGPRQAGDRVRKALQSGATCIVSVGGDGTHNEVIQGFYQDGELVRPDAELAVVPTGTGGDLRRTLGLPQPALEAIECLGKARRRIDVGHLTCVDHHGEPYESYFLNIASFGISGLVDKLVNNSSKALGGKLSFIWGVTRATVRYKNQRVRFRLDGGEPIERSIYNLAVANARYFGGGMKVAPDAQMADGRFDVVVLGDLGITELMARMPDIYKGAHLDHPKIEVFSATNVYAEPASPEDKVLIDMDGEAAGRLPATLKILPDQITMHVGPDAQIADA